MPQAGRSRRGGFRPGGFPPAVEDREQPFERPRTGRVHALGGGGRVLGRHDQLQASLARGLPYRGGRARADAPRSARAVGTEGSSSPTAMVFSSRPCGSSRWAVRSATYLGGLGRVLEDRQRREAVPRSRSPSVRSP